MPGVQYIPHPTSQVYEASPDYDQFIDFGAELTPAGWRSYETGNNLLPPPMSTPWSDHPIATYKGYSPAPLNITPVHQGSSSASPSPQMSHFMHHPPQQQPYYAWSSGGGSTSTEVSPCSTPPLSVSGQNITRFDFPVPVDSHSAIKDRRRSPPVNGGYLPPILTLPRTGPPRRISGACARCRRLKMKCEFKEDAPNCSRCTTGKHECILEEKKPRTPGEREKLLSKIRQRETQVESVIDLVKEEATPHHVTPLTFVPSKIHLDPRDKDQFRNVIANASNPKRPSPAQLHDIKTLLENEEWTSSGSSSTTSPISDDGSSTYSSLPPISAPIGYIAHASLQQERERSFFNPGPLDSQSLRSILIERGDDAPHILVHGLFTLHDVEILFDIFFKNIYPMIGLLDPDIHTPSAVLVRSPFLFTVICAIASRYLRFQDDQRPETYTLAMHYAKTAAASSLIDGRKTVEMCQAYILMCLYAPKGKRFEDDRTWFYSGVAMRLATDLGLHEIPSKPEAGDERTIREWNNRVRTWMVCFNLDRSFASQYGRPSTLQEDDHIRNLNWYKMPFGTSYDVHTQGHTGLLQIMTRFHDMMKNSSDGKKKNTVAIVEASERELTAFEVDLTERYQNDSDPTDEGCRFRVGLNPFTFNYSRLVMAQQALESESGEQHSVLLVKALHAATTVIRAFLEKVANSGLIRYAPDCYFVYVGYAATFLLKLIDPRSTNSAECTLDQDQTDRIIALVSALVHTLGSVAIDENHTPKLYARFLSGILNRISQHFYSSIPPPVSATSTGSSSTHNSPSSHHDFPTQYDVPPLQPFVMEPTSWDDLYNFPAGQGSDPAHDLGAAWTFGDNANSWDINSVCPSVTYLNHNAFASSPQISTYTF